MVDEEQQSTDGATGVEATTTDHPEAGTAEVGGSVPEPCPATNGTFATLVLKRSGAETDIAFPINPPAVIGRFDPGVGPIDVDLGMLPEGSYVSRRHAKIICLDGVWMLEDMGSSNGTFVLRDDFERVQERADLTDGMEIAFGNARFVFHLTEERA